MEKAGFWIRFVACFIDGIIIGIMQWPINLALLPFQSDDPFNPNWYVLSIQWIVQITVSGFYFGYFLSKKGATPGKMCFGLRLVDTDSGKNVTVGKALAREFIGKFISSAILMIGFIMAGFRADKKALHDLLCHTQVVRVRR